MEYKDKVFADMIETLGNSVKKNAKTKQEAMQGLELLVNFNKIFSNYDNVLKTLKREEEREENYEIIK